MIQAVRGHRRARLPIATRRMHGAWLAMALCALVGCSGPRGGAFGTGPSSLDVVPAARDIETTRRRATEGALDAAVARANSEHMLERVRREISPHVSYVPTLPTSLRYAQRDVASVQERIARIKTASRRYLDAADYRAALDGLPQASFENVDNRIDRVGRRTIRRLPHVDSLSTRRARLLDVTSLEVQAFLYRVGMAHLGARVDEGHVVLRDSVLGRSDEVARVWSIGDPLPIHPTGSAGRNANPMQTRFSVPIYRAGRVYGILSFNAYAGTVSTSTVFGNDLSASRFPLMTLSDAEDLVAEHTGERPVRSIHIDPFFDLLLTFPAVLTAEGSVYLVDPVLEAVW